MQPGCGHNRSSSGIFAARRTTGQSNQSAYRRARSTHTSHPVTVEERGHDGELVAVDDRSLDPTMTASKSRSGLTIVTSSAAAFRRRAQGTVRLRPMSKYSDPSGSGRLLLGAQQFGCGMGIAEPDAGQCLVGGDKGALHALARGGESWTDLPNASCARVGSPASSSDRPSKHAGMRARNCRVTERRCDRRPGRATPGMVRFVGAAQRLRVRRSLPAACAHGHGR
jgi:hypothetical protein